MPGQRPAVAAGAEGVIWRPTGKTFGDERSYTNFEGVEFEWARSMGYPLSGIEVRMGRTGIVHLTEMQGTSPWDGLDLTINDQDVADLESAPRDMEKEPRNDIKDLP